ncbi:MAG: ThiF family adenylyltransferase, partial [Parafannyhessea umbonata]|nr:ThiF family adenylyltransferase [Parafannyhessea umbonata]
MGEKDADVPAEARSAQGGQGVETATDRLRIILGQERLDVLASSRVLVLGLGGVGSNCVEALARGGVGELVLVDRDIVQPSNINRQAVAYHSTIGRAKTDVMEEIVHDINPDCRVTTVHRFLSKENLVPTLEA